MLLLTASAIFFFVCLYDFVAFTAFGHRRRIKLKTTSKMKTEGKKKRHSHKMTELSFTLGQTSPLLDLRGAETVGSSPTECLGNAVKVFFYLK